MSSIVTDLQGVRVFDLTEETTTRAARTTTVALVWTGDEINTADAGPQRTYRVFVSRGGVFHEAISYRRYGFHLAEPLAARVPGLHDAEIRVTVVGDQMVYRTRKYS